MVSGVNPIQDRSANQRDVHLLSCIISKFHVNLPPEFLFDYKILKINTHKL